MPNSKWSWSWSRKHVQHQIGPPHRRSELCHVFLRVLLVGHGSWRQRGSCGPQRQRHPNLSRTPRDPLLGVGHPKYLFLNFTGHFGGSRYPVVPPRGEPVARAACGSPAHLESACAGLPSKTTQEATSRRALGPVESSGGELGPDKMPQNLLLWLKQE